MGDWLGIPKDILESTFGRLDNDLIDELSFSAVCTQWRSMTAEKGRHLFPRIMLMVTDEDNDKPDIGNFHNLCSLTDNLYKNRLPYVKRWSNCYGSLNGSLITVDRKSGDIYLVNPISGTKNLIPSPSVLTIEGQETGPISKVVVSFSRNSKEDYVILVFRLASKNVYLYKKGDEKWTAFEIRFGGISEVAYYRDKLYAICTNGDIEVFNLQNPELKSCMINIREPSAGVLRGLLKIFADVRRLHIPKRYGEDATSYKVYLVKTPEDELLMVIQHVALKKTVGFKVFKFVEGVEDWNLVESLGEWVLFLGLDSVCLMAHDVPECQPNSIYFTGLKETNSIYFTGLGVFNMEDESIRPLYENHPFKHSNSTWFTPKLQLREI